MYDIDTNSYSRIGLTDESQSIFYSKVGPLALIDYNLRAK